MKRILFRLTFALVSLLVFSIAPVFAQDFQQTYRLNAGDVISIRNVSGNINLTGYDGDAIVVAGYKEGRDRELVDVEDKSSGNRLDLGVRYPRNCNCNASIRFEVRVPRSIRYEFNQISTASGEITATAISGNMKINTASGNVSIKDVTGSVNASTASGEMQIRDVKGTVSASTASGNVDVEIARLEGTENMRFSSASGDVNVRLPSNLDADVHMSTASGDVKTNFPLEVKRERHGSGSTARGQLGNGSRSLRISTASGNVSLNSM